MKKIFKMVASAALFVGFVFTGCNNYFSNDAYYSSNDENGTTEKTIIIHATSEEHLIEFDVDSDSARTILPEAIGSSKLEFYIGAKKAGETNYTFKKTTFAKAGGTDEYKGSVSETYDLASYEFKLYAIPQGATLPAQNTDDPGYKALAYFAGYAAADLRYNDEVSFYLSSNSLSGNNGSFTIDITSTWDIPAGYKVTAVVTPQDSDTPIHPTGAAAPLDITPATLPGKVSQTETGNNAFAKTGIPVGSYNVIIEITAPASAGGKSYVYSEKMSILPGRTSKGSIEIPDIIEYAPTRPSELIVAYSTPLTTDKDFYNVEFAWSDSSYCERGFQLELLLADHNTKYFVPPTTDAEWDAITGAGGLALTNTQNAASTTLWSSEFDTNLLVLNKTNFSQFRNAINDGVGTLNMNDDHVTIQLPMEHRFYARICAYNDVGPSDYTYLDFSKAALAGCTKGDTLTKTNASSADQKAQITNTPTYTMAGSKFDADVASINLFKIKYNLNGGIFTDANESETEMPALISYHSQRNKVVTGSITAAASDTAEFILSPDSKAAIADPATAKVEKTKNTYIGTAGNKKTDLYLQLKNGDYYWKKWVKNSTSGDDYPTTGDVPDIYTGYTNIQLFAVYLTSTQVDAPVQIEDITAYELEKTDILIALKGAGDADKTEVYITPTAGTGNPATLEDAEKKLVGSPNLLQIPSSGTNLVRKLSISANTSCYAYYKMHITLTRNGDNIVIFDDDWVTSAPKDITIDGERTGKYVLAITASAIESPNVTYRIATVFEITQ